MLRDGVHLPRAPDKRDKPNRFSVPFCRWPRNYPLSTAPVSHLLASAVPHLPRLLCHQHQSAALCDAPFYDKHSRQASEAHQESVAALPCHLDAVQRANPVHPQLCVFIWGGSLITTYSISAFWVKTKIFVFLFIFIIIIIIIFNY